MKNFICFTIILFGISTYLTSQVSDVKFLIEYDDSTSLYEAKIYIAEGEATEYVERIQFNSQYTIVVPAGSLLTIDTLYNPKENNANYDGTIPCLWEFGPKEYSPPTAPNLDFHTVFPNLSPPSAYDNLYEGDTITLFGFHCDANPCTNEVRPFENGIDPGSAEMPGGGDFSCGFSLAGSGGMQIYSGNLYTIYSDNSISINDTLWVCQTDCITLDPTISCPESIIGYTWSTGETSSSIEVCPTETTEYSLQLEDIYGNVEDLSVVVAFGSSSLNTTQYTICAGDSLLLESCGMDTWTAASANPAGATITLLPSSLYKVSFDPTSNGIYTFIYTRSDNNTHEIEVIVNPKPILTIENTELCLGNTMMIESNITSGTWTSNNPLVAVVNSVSGQVTPYAEGEVVFTFTSEAGCTSSTGPINVFDGVEAELIGEDTICYLGTTSVLPNTGGTWVSADPSIVTIDNNGNITGISAGTTSVIHTNESTGCQSNPIFITVTVEDVEFLGSDQICVGEMTFLSSWMTGTWTTPDPTIVTIENGGLVIGISPGVANLVWTDDVTGCQSMPLQVTVSDVPILTSEAYELCIGETTQITSNQNGTWASFNPNVATINTITGLVTAVGPGTCNFSFENEEGCSVSTDPLSITVFANPIVEITGDESICIGGTTTLSPNTDGTWVSADPSIATVSAFTGIVTGVSIGQTYFTYTSTNTGCTSNATLPITVTSENATPVANNNGPICEGWEIQLFTDAVAGATYQWAGPGGFTSTDQNPVLTNLTALESGSYCVSYTVDGCSSGWGCTDVLILPIPPTPITYNNGPTCEGEDLVLFTDFVAGATYSWTGPGGFYSNDQNPVISNINAVYNGTYCVVTTVDGCESDPGCTEVEVSQVPLTPVVTNNGPICDGEDIELTTNAVSGATYFWSGPDGYTSNNQNPTLTNVTVSAEGQYCLIVTVNGCESEAGCTDVEINPIPQTPTLMSNSPICSGDNLELSTNNVFSGTFAWSGPNSFTSSDQNPIITNASTSNNGQYCLVVSVEGCESEIACIDIEINDHIEIENLTSNSPLCQGDDLTFSLEFFNADTYLWTDPNGNVFSSEKEPILPTIGLNESGTYCVEITSGNCVQQECTDVVVLTNDPVPNSQSNSPVCVGKNIELSVDEITNGVYEWEGPNGFTSSERNPIIPNATEDDAGLYTLLAYNANSLCANTQVIIIQVEVNNCIELDSACDEITAEDIVCDFDQLNGITGSLLSTPSDGNQPPGDLCESDDAAQNISWLGFVALDGDYDIIINTYNCTAPAGVVSGVQIGVYSDCSFSSDALVFCDNQTGVDNQVTISSDLLEKEQTYYLYIDGLEASVCDFTIQVDGFYDNTYCTDLSKVTGVAYVDQNENGTYEVGEILLRNAMISLTPGNMSVLTNNEGKYIINTPKGDATLTAKMYEGHWINNEITIEDVTVFEQCVEDINFGFVPNLFYQEGKVSVSNTVTRCNWETYFYFTVENTGTIDMEARVDFEFDEKTTYFATNHIGLQVNGKTATANLGTMTPFEVREFWIKLKMPPGSAVLPVLDFKTTLFNSEEMQMDQYEWSEQLRCSYDPNDKRTFPDREGEDNLTLMDEELEYTIRFQNNGNDTAFVVKIIDPIDPNIDPASIRVINSSHAVETCIENENLIFLFEDIFLVDSMTNYEGSQGYVSYRCNTKEGRAENTIVNNTADIIFDSNAPIITNTTINTLVSELCTDVTTEIDIEICDGEDYNGYTESGTYTEIFPLQYGCDSMVLIHLDVQGVTYSAQSIEVCEGEVFEINEIEYILYESQQIRDSITNELGCLTDVFIFNITVNPVVSTVIDTTICEGFDYEGLTESGSYTIDSFDMVTGCSIFTTINLEVLPLSDPACIVSIDETEFHDLKLYPNPARSRFYIESERTIDEVCIYTMAYKKAKEVNIQNPSHQLEVNTELLEAGLYLVVIKSGDQIIHRKIILD